MKVYFSDWFDVDPKVLHDYGAFNVSLINDLPLFVDPFLLFTSKDDTYRRLHEEMIAYLRYLRDQAVDGTSAEALVDSLYRFPEVRQLWLGFSLKGNAGTGLGPTFARALHRNMGKLFVDFGDSSVTNGTHMEKLCLFDEGVGRDHVSDFTANLIKGYLLEYTSAFAKQHIDKKKRRRMAVRKVAFDFEQELWLHGTYDLPFATGLPFSKDDYVLLAPRDILTKDDNWINRRDLYDEMHQIVNAIPDEQLRAQMNSFILKRLKPGATKEQRDNVYHALLRKFPVLADYFIQRKEKKGPQAIVQSAQRVEASERQFVQLLAGFVRELGERTAFYDMAGSTYDEAHARVGHLKHVIENAGGHRLFWPNGKAIEREHDLQILFKLTWYATPSDFTSEANDGRGPVDFKISRGARDKTLVEFKLAKNKKLAHGLTTQVGLYRRASQVKKCIVVIFYFSTEQRLLVERILRKVKRHEDRDVVLVDCRNDNKASASVAPSDNE